MCKDRLSPNALTVALSLLLVSYCSSVHSSEQTVSNGDCNAQIQGNNINVDMSGCGKVADKQKHESHLEIVEILTSKDTVLDLGIRNSGDLIAFINGVQLIFGPMYCGSNVCMPGLGFTRYSYDVKLSNGKAELLHNASIEIDSKESLRKENRLERWKALAKELDSESDVEETKKKVIQEPKYYEYLSPENAAKELRSNTTASTIKSYSGGLGGVGDYDVELHNLTIKKSPILRISQPVSPKEITRLKIDLEFLDKGLYLSSCINTCSLEAHAIVYFDSKKALKTTEFGFYFTNLK